MLNARRKAILLALMAGPVFFLMLAPITQAKADATMELGKKVFTELAEPHCALCHALKDAGSEGEIGPVLDELELTEEKVEKAVRGGLGVMPAFEEKLTDEQIKAVSQYVTQVAGK